MGRPTLYTPDEAILKTHLLFTPEYIYAKSAAEILGMSKYAFNLLAEGNEDFPKLYKRGRRTMYKYKEIIEYAERQANRLHA